MTEQADKWIKWTTTGCLALLALIAGTVSYLHMHTIVALHRQPGWVAALTALSVDGMIAAASATLLAESRSEQRGALLPWALLVAGSQAANVAAAERTLIGRVIAAWPSFALTASYELLTRQVRRNVTIAERGNNAEVSRLSQALARPGAERRLAPVRSVSPSKVGDRHAGRDLQRRAWQRVLVNRDPMARFRTAAQSPAVRSPRTLGRLVKRPA